MLQRTLWYAACRATMNAMQQLHSSCACCEHKSRCPAATPWGKNADGVNQPPSKRPCLTTHL